SPSRLSLDQQLDAITIEGDRFWDAIDAAPDLKAQVPSCPDWSIEQLAGHLLGVHSAWTEMVEHPAEDPTHAFELEVATRDQSGTKEGLVRSGRDRHRRMVDVFRSADQQQQTWTWAEQQDVAFITRHQVQEAAVHRWDAQTATAVAVD